MNNLHKIIIDATKDIPIAFLKKMLREKITNAGKIPDEEMRSEEHTSELQPQSNLVCRLLLEKKKNKYQLKPQSNKECCTLATKINKLVANLLNTDTEQSYMTQSSETLIHVVSVRVSTNRPRL